MIVKTQLHQMQAAEVSLKPTWLKHWGRRKHKEFSHSLWREEMERKQRCSTP